ncbi:hypothetical protein QPK14_13920 [Photorhabdus temperata subsp. temperata]|nr:hypothetical protein [Photorhabdus temperata]
MNEVTGNRRSELQGQLEIVGNKTHVMIANPTALCSFSFYLFSLFWLLGSCFLFGDSLAKGKKQTPTNTRF